MPRLRVATHIALALALMSVSLVMLAQWLGLAPDPSAERRSARELTARLIAELAAHGAQADDYDRFELLADEFVSRAGGVESVEMRLLDGTVVSRVGRGEAQPPETRRILPGPGEVRIPIMREGQPYAQIAIQFEPAPGRSALAWVSHPLFPLVLFLLVAGFVTYRLYMRRVLQYLDPSQVIPERVRLVLDSLFEGVLILDQRERVVLANRSWVRMSGIDADSLVGVPASSLPWRDPLTGGEALVPPWLETLDDGAVRAGVRMEFLAVSGPARVASITCAPVLGPDGVRRGVLVTIADLTESEARRAELEDLLRTLARSRTEIEEQNRELNRLATTDALTDCMNRRELMNRVEQLWSLARRHAGRLSCIMIDVDHFKRVNDTHGHQVGDAVLVHVAALLRAAGRTEDLVARYGGEEFCLMLPDTAAADAMVVAERVRSAVELTPSEGPSVTVSVGVADAAAAQGSIESLLARADQALYQAKRAGRNRVRLAPEDQRRDAA